MKLRTHKAISVHKAKTIFFSLFFITIFFAMGIMGFLWWNYYPPLPTLATYPIETIDNITPFPQPQFLKIVSYNIHFGVGSNWKEKKLSKRSFLIRLRKIADILRHIDADIVLLQEVDFDARRSQYIDQARFLAQAANYPYVAKGSYQREKFHPHLYGMHGRINHGLCILSRFPLISNQMRVFNFAQSMPFYLKWLYTPHGAQKVQMKINGKVINVFNVHLEPWEQQKREEEIQIITDWTKNIHEPLIIGGDFNATPPEDPEKKGYHLQDAPWFINRKNWDIENEKTIMTIRQAGFSEAISTTLFLSNPIMANTFPSNNPLEKIDYIFTKNNTKMLYGYVYNEARNASDHLPLVAVIKY